MSNWRLVDVDHFAKGASYFNKLVGELDWHKSVEDKIGTHEKRVKVIKEPEQAKEAKKIISLYESYIDLKEPRSNRGLEQFKGKEELEEEKKKAKEIAVQRAKEA